VKLRLERELEGWKGLRLERGSARGGLAFPGPDGYGLGSVSGSIRRGSIRDGRPGSSLGLLPATPSSRDGEKDVTTTTTTNNNNNNNNTLSTPSAAVAGTGGGLQPGPKQLRRVSGAPRFL
jgi:hypothetical protein